MGTAERYGAVGTGVATIAETERDPRTPGRGIPAYLATADVAVGAERGTGIGAERGTGARTAPAASAAGTRSVAGPAGSAVPPGHEEHMLAETGETGETGEYTAVEDEERAYHRPLWVEEPADRRRLPDPVRASAVRAVLIIAVTLIQAMVAFFCTMAGSWLAFPMVLSSVASTVVATWGALDVWVTRQVWNQRNGVVSEPSSTARALRRERRRARRQERTAERARVRIQRRRGAGQLSHP